jgi:Rrf2 family protein
MSSFRFRKKTDYGLSMIETLAKRDGSGLVSVREMQELGMPRSFLVKIARDLIEAGIVAAKEGRNGGYYLVRDKSKVTLLDVVVALEGKIATADCVCGKECKRSDKCEHKSLMMQVSMELAAVLEKYTLADFEKTK